MCLSHLDSGGYGDIVRMATKPVVCSQCREPFEKQVKDINKAAKNGYKNHFCSRACDAQYKREHPEATINDGIRRYSKSKENLEHLARVRDQRKPGLFTETLKRARACSKKKGVPMELTPEILLRVWTKQGGKCPYTGWDLELPKCGKGYKKKSWNSASLDRRDSLLGYTEENVWFVSVMANLAKCDFDEHLLLWFCQSVIGHWGTFAGKFEVAAPVETATKVGGGDEN